MKTVKIVLEQEKAYLLPLSDLHIGDKAFKEKELQGYIDWVKKEKNALVWLNGDLMNVATKVSPSSIFDQDLTLEKQIDKVVEIFTPIKDRILGAISGNHEQRLESMLGYNPLIPVCKELGIQWCNYSAVLDITVSSKQNKINKNEVPRYTFYCHHTVGGGGTVGSKINRVAKLREIVSNADVYVGSHNHQLAVVPVETRTYNFRRNKVEAQRQLLVDTGSFLGYSDAYAEMKQLQPSKLGAVRIRMDGRKKDIHADL